MIRITRIRGRQALGITLAAGLAVMVVAADPARADTLAEAMASAYLGNPVPVLQGERARQRATDEQVPQALSGWRPTVVLRGDGGYE